MKLILYNAPNCPRRIVRAELSEHKWGGDGGGRRAVTFMCGMIHYNL